MQIRTIRMCFIAELIVNAGVCRCHNQSAGPRIDPTCTRRDQLFFCCDSCLPEWNLEAFSALKAAPEEPPGGSDCAASLGFCYHG